MFNAKRLSGWVALAVFATIGGAGGVMVAADPAFAKVDVDKLTIGGEIRVRYEIRNNTFFGSTDGLGRAIPANESAGSHRVRINVGYDLTPDVSFFAHVQDARVWGSECVAGACAATSGIGTVSSSNQNSAGVDLHQGYIQVKNVLVPGLGLKVGRQEIIYGDHRLFGNFNWSQNGNSFDAGKIMWNSEMVDVDLFWARIIDTELGDGCAAGNANCHGTIFPALGTRGTTDQDIYGTYVTLKLGKSWTIEPYYFLLKDSRLTPGGAGFNAAPVGAQSPDQARNILGGRINGKAGGLDLTLEGDWQFGGMSNVGTGEHNLHINAHQEAARIGYTFEPVPMKPRIGIEVDYASGDSCAAKAATNRESCQRQGHLNTADNLYPTNHFHYGYMDLMSWRNMVGYSAMFDVKPSDVSKFQVNFWLLRLAKATDNWYRANQGVYAAPCAGTGSAAACTGETNQAKSLGKEIDVHYWHTFKEKFKFEVGYGHFWAGEFVEKNATTNNTSAPHSTASFNSSQTDQDWYYTMVSILF